MNPIKVSSRIIEVSFHEGSGIWWYLDLVSNSIFAHQPAILHTQKTTSNIWTTQRKPCLCIYWCRQFSVSFDFLISVIRRLLPTHMSFQFDPKMSLGCTYTLLLRRACVACSYVPVSNTPHILNITARSCAQLMIWYINLDIVLAINILFLHSDLFDYYSWSGSFWAGAWTSSWLSISISPKHWILITQPGASSISKVFSVLHFLISKIKMVLWPRRNQSLLQLRLSLY